MACTGAPDALNTMPETPRIAKRLQLKVGGRFGADGERDAFAPR